MQKAGAEEGGEQSSNLQDGGHETADPPVDPEEMPAPQPDEPVPQAVLQPVLQSEIQPDLQPDLRPDLQSDLQSDLQPLLQSEIQPDLQPDLQPVLQSEIQPDLQSDLRPVLRPVLQSDLQSDLQPVLQPDLQSDLQPVLQSEIQPDLQPDLQPVFQPDLQPVLQPVFQPDLQPVFQPVFQPVLQPDLQPLLQPDLQPVFQPVFQPVLQPVFQPLLQPDLQPVFQPDLQPVLQLDLSEAAQGDTAHMSAALSQEEEEEEEEELTILDMDHPLVRTYHDGMTVKFRGRLEKLSLGLDEKRAVVKADEQYSLEAYTRLFKIQKNLTTRKNKLEDSHCALADAKTKCLQVQDQQGETKSRYSMTSNQHNQVKAEVSRLQTELDKVMEQLIFTQGVSGDLHSKVKTMTTVRRKVGAEKTQAEEQKLKQDLYIEHLTKGVERLTQQIAMYEAQARAQAEEKCTVKEALYESEMVIETLFMAHKQLLQQWNSSLMTIKRRDEAFNAMQDVVWSVKHQVITLDREIEGQKKSISGLQDRNETLTMQLNWSEMEFATHKKLISQKQANQEALLAHYNSCSRTLLETEKTIANCTKEIGTYQTELNNQRRQLEKESAVRLALEDKIMTHMQQKLTHNKAAQDSQQLLGKMATLKKAKICHLEQLENELSSARPESQQVDQHVSLLVVTQEALDEELAMCEKLLTLSENQMYSLVQIIKQKGQAISNYNYKLSEIKAKTGHEYLSPLQLKVEEIMVQTEELAACIQNDQQLWLRQQGALVMLTQEIEAKSKEMSKLGTEYIAMQQRKIRFESQYELEEREESELENTMTLLNRDLVKLSSLVSEKKQLSQVLEQDNALMKTKYLQTLKDAEWESVNMQMNLEKVQEESERLFNALVESEQQLMLWEKKAQILKETFSTLDTGQDEIKQMKDEIHRMEMRVEQLKKQQESLMRESETVVETWENITLHEEAKARTSHKKNIKGELKRSSEGLQRKIWETCNQVKECEQVYRELQKTQDSMSDRLVEEKKWMIELFSTTDILDSDLVNLQDTKETSRSKKLRAVHEGSYEASSSSGTVVAALQSQMEHLQTVSTILHRECEDVPEHIEALRKVMHALAARTQVL